MPIYAQGENPFLGIDNRGGLTANDGSAITVFTMPNLSKVIRVNLLITFTAFTSGTATYTVTWTENGAGLSFNVVATALNTPVGLVRLIRPDSAANIVVQLSGSGFVGTVKVTCILEDLV